MLSTRRSKIGADPNNTKWAKSTDRFGHKILTAQGWKPGDTLGAENASHSSHYTSASSSHIRVLLRDDNLGLGAKNGKQEADKFGLDMFQGLLGRLNGKSQEELDKEAGYRRDLALKEMVVKRFGGTTFVSGGYLVGDKIERSVHVQQESSPAAFVAVKEKKSKKRKRTEEVEPDHAATQIKAQSSADETEVKEKKKRSKKDKKRNDTTIETPLPSDPEAEQEEEATLQDKVPEEMSEKESKRLRKAEKRAAKEARRAEKAERKRKRREDELKDEAATSAPSTPVDTSDTEATTSEAPSTSLQKTVAVPRGRFAIRSRYSQQKRMAASDQQALKEIFMIKAGA